MLRREAREAALARAEAGAGHLQCPRGGVRYAFIYWLNYYPFLPSPEDVLIDLRERGREGDGKGEKHLCERQTSISFLWHTPWLGTKPRPRHVSWPGIKLATFRFQGWCSNQLSHTSQGYWLNYWWVCIIELIRKKKIYLRCWKTTSICVIPPFNRLKEKTYMLSLKDTEKRSGTNQHHSWVFKHKNPRNFINMTSIILWKPTAKHHIIWRKTTKKKKKKKLSAVTIPICIVSKFWIIQ